jgi:hypothetical protein
MNVYYAALSNADLDEVCEALRIKFGLPPFEFDSHDTWRYAQSTGVGMRLNITKADDVSTIETWMPDCPKGVNFQVILSVESEPADFVTHLSEILGSEVVRYAKTAL